jgi:hypothetical protein
MIAWGILIGVAVTLLLQGIGKAFTAYATKNWFHQNDQS